MKFISYNLCTFTVALAWGALLAPPISHAAFLDTVKSENTSLVLEELETNPKQTERFEGFKEAWNNGTNPNVVNTIAIVVFSVRTPRLFDWVVGQMDDDEDTRLYSIEILEMAVQLASRDPVTARKFVKQFNKDFISNLVGNYMYDYAEEMLHKLLSKSDHLIVQKRMKRNREILAQRREKKGILPSRLRVAPLTARFTATPALSAAVPFLTDEEVTPILLEPTYQDSPTEIKVEIRNPRAPFCRLRPKNLKVRFEFSGAILNSYDLIKPWPPSKPRKKTEIHFLPPLSPTRTPLLDLDSALQIRSLH